MAPSTTADATFSLHDFLPDASDSGKTALFLGQLAGTYRLIEVFTEGVGLGREVVESRLVIRQRARIDTSARMGYAPNVIADATGQVLRSGDPKLRLRRVPADSGQFHLTVSYWAPDRMEFQPTHPGYPDLVLNDDPRLYYRVMVVSDSGTISGRFAGGGLGIPQIRSPVGILAEQQSGYFCAFKEATARPSR